MCAQSVFGCVSSWDHITLSPLLSGGLAHYNWTHWGVKLAIEPRPWKPDPCTHDWKKPRYSIILVRKQLDSGPSRLFLTAALKLGRDQAGDEIRRNVRYSAQPLFSSWLCASITSFTVTVMCFNDESNYNTITKGFSARFVQHMNML